MIDNCKGQLQTKTLLLRQRFHRLKPPYPHPPPHVAGSEPTLKPQPLFALPSPPPPSKHTSSLTKTRTRRRRQQQPLRKRSDATFHGYAKSGNVSGPAVYANYGRVQDFAALNVSGAVVVARYGEIYRGDIVRNAYSAGAVGVVIYTDKRDYGGGGGDECFR
ncbi:PA domain protein [Raphanus sativus]|nr:PA domain protein [Raphanus sativus]